MESSKQRKILDCVMFRKTIYGGTPGSGMSIAALLDIVKPNIAHTGNK